MACKNSDQYLMLGFVRYVIGQYALNHTNFNGSLGILAIS